jgi:microcin C transport system ATP-binding protein
MNSRPVRNVVEPSGAAEPAVRAASLRVTYPVPKPGFAGWFSSGRFVALGSADFDVPAGQTLGIIGESGSGKSTLALATLGLVPFTGQLEIAAKRWGPSSAGNLALRKRIQVVFQDPFSSLSPRMTVEEIVGEGLLVHAPLLSASERLQKVELALRSVGLDDAQFPGLLQRYVHQFSGGQRQRIAIARALIVEPQILVLDEPTSALDVTMAQQILQLLQHLQKKFGLSYVLITHDVEVVRAMAHSVLVLKNGEIVESGSLEQVFMRPAAAYTRALLAASE